MVVRRARCIFSYICTMKHTFILLLVATLLAVGCSSKSKREAGRPSAVATNEFRVPAVPMHITPENHRDYMVEHYWDAFDFSDTLRLTKLDTLKMLRAYATYVGQFVGPQDGASMRRLMRRADVSRKMMDYFLMLAERVLHDPNSPLRSDELYIAVLESQIASPYYDSYEKLAPEYDLQLAKQNRVGHEANDIVYTTRDGRRRRLYGLQGDFVLLYFNNPGCAMCGDVTAALQRSPIISQAVAEGRLKVLTLYPDEDIKAWRSHIASLPREWINGYDHGCAIRRTQSYDLRAIPSLYLLDAEKRVVLKDCTDVALVEDVLLRRYK